MEPFASRSRNGRYGAAVAAVDWSTGVLMAELERLGLTENAIVIFTSDNGSHARVKAAAIAHCVDTKAPHGKAACASRASSAGPPPSAPDP